MRPIEEKVQAYHAATELLARGEDKQLRYVALELRRCIEDVVYEKLEGYRTWISEKLARTWQPPQAFRALLEIDPGGQSDSVIAVAPEARLGGPPTTPPKVIGTDRRPTVKWLTDTWNKLGSDLHATWPYSRKGQQGNRREFYNLVLLDLAPFVTNHFTMAMANVVSFECEKCGQTVVISCEGLRISGHATCLSCSLRYSYREQDGATFFFLEEPTIECENCHQSISLPSAEIEDGYEFHCLRCKTRYRAIVERWGFRRLSEAASNGPKT